jgi:hypothetical protein
MGASWCLRPSEQKSLFGYFTGSFGARESEYSFYACLKSTHKSKSGELDLSLHHSSDNVLGKSIFFIIKKYFLKITLELVKVMLQLALTRI